MALYEEVIALISEIRLPFFVRFLRCTSFGFFPSKVVFGSLMHSMQIEVAAC